MPAQPNITPPPNIQQQKPPKKSFLQKQIPTILGLVVLVGALIAGIFFVGQGTGVFAPRATPQTTPKLIKVTNVTDTSFTVSFLTDESTAGFVKYGTEANSTNSQSSDDRDQLSGTVGNYRLHHITVRGLKPNTRYYYLLGTGSRSTFDNNGSPFDVTTSQQAGVPSAAKTAYGNVVDASGNPAEGSVVYVAIDGVGEMSSLVKASGSWAVPLSNARKANGGGYAEVAETDEMTVTVQGPGAAQQSAFNVEVRQAQPVATVTLGEVPDDVGGSASVSQGVDATPGGDASASGAASGSGDLSSSPTPTSNPDQPGGLGSLIDLGGYVATTSTEIDLEKEPEGQRVATSSPTIKGTAAPNVTVTITVNSEHTITQQLTTDANGEFVLDLEALKENLEPGEHTATYTYTDPNTNQQVTKTVTFTVEDPNAVGGTQSSTSPSPTPFGSGNPFPAGSATGSGGATGSASPSPSGQSTRSGLPSTGSGVPVSGSVGTTLTLVFGGAFFIAAGLWSYWLAGQVQET